MSQEKVTIPNDDVSGLAERSAGNFKAAVGTGRLLPVKARVFNRFVDAIINSLSATKPYKVYSALLTQSGTDAPVATVLENTLGDIVWTRNNNGIYTGTLADTFLVNKTHCLVTNNQIYDVIITTLGRNNDNTIILNTLDNTFTPIDIIDVYVEIRVYN